jgi:hypothetical protein
MPSGLAADFDGVFLAWFGEAKYKAHLRRALIEKAEGGISELIDYVRRLE